MSDDAEPIRSTTDNHARLREYLSSCLVDATSMERYSVCSGDEEFPRQQDRTLRLAEIVSAEFEFLERQRTIVISDPNNA